MRVVEPIPARSFLEHVFKRAKTDRHQNDARVIGVLEQAQIRLVDVDQERDQQRDRYTRREVNVEEPVPIQGIGDPATDDRAEVRPLQLAPSSSPRSTLLTAVVADRPPNGRAADVS